MTTLLTNDFKTPIGIIRTYIKSDKTHSVVTTGQNTIVTSEHHLCLECFELCEDWLPPPMSVEMFRGWRWFITKTSNKGHSEVR